MQNQPNPNLNMIAWYLGMLMFFVSLMALLIFVVLKLFGWIDMAWAHALFFVALMLANRFFIWLIQQVWQKMAFWQRKK